MIEKIISMLTLIGMFAGAWIYIDEHYATAADLKRLSVDVKMQSLYLRKQSVDDRIFELEFKKNSSGGKLSPLEQAQLDKYKRELDELISRQRDVDKDK